MEKDDKGHSNEGFDGSPAAGGFLDVGRPVNNGHTYVYEPDKSLSRYNKYHFVFYPFIKGLDACIMLWDM